MDFSSIKQELKQTGFSEQTGFRPSRREMETRQIYFSQKCPKGDTNFSVVFLVETFASFFLFVRFLFAYCCLSCAFHSTNLFGFDFYCLWTTVPCNVSPTFEKCHPLLKGKVLVYCDRELKSCHYFLCLITSEKLARVEDEFDHYHSLLFFSFCS